VDQSSSRSKFLIRQFLPPQTLISSPQQVVAGTIFGIELNRCFGLLLCGLPLAGIKVGLGQLIMHFEFTRSDFRRAGQERNGLVQTIRLRQQRAQVQVRLLRMGRGRLIQFDGPLVGRRGSRLITS